MFIRESISLTFSIFHSQLSAMSLTGSFSYKKSETVVRNTADNLSTVDNSLAVKGFKYCPTHLDIWIAKPKRMIGYKARSCPECDKHRNQGTFLVHPSITGLPNQPSVANHEDDMDDDLGTLEDDQDASKENDESDDNETSSLMSALHVELHSPERTMQTTADHSPIPIATLAGAPQLQHLPHRAAFSFEEFDEMRQSHQRELDRITAEHEEREAKLIAENEELKLKLSNEEDERAKLWSASSETSSVPIMMPPCKPYKIILLGETDVGKSALIARFVNGKFSQPTLTTVGLCDAFVPVPFGDETKWFQICDTAGQERFRSIAPLYFRSAHAVMFCFDITRKESFTGLRSFIAEVNRTCGEGKVAMVFVGCKGDLAAQRMVQAEDGEAYARKHEGQYFESSAKKGDGVHTAFLHTIQEAVRRFPNHPPLESPAIIKVRSRSVSSATSAVVHDVRSRSASSNPSSAPSVVQPDAEAKARLWCCPLW